jgi:hypothetical protein
MTTYELVLTELTKVNDWDGTLWCVNLSGWEGDELEEKERKKEIKTQIPEMTYTQTNSPCRC